MTKFRSSPLLARIFGAALAAISGLMLTRALGPEGRGVWATLLSYNSLVVQTFHLGLPTTHTYLSGRKRDLIPRLLSNLKYWSLLSLLGVALSWGVFTAARGATPHLVLLHGMCVVLSTVTILQLCLESIRIGMGDAPVAYWSDFFGRVALTVGYLALMRLALVRPVFCLLIAATVALIRALYLYFSIPIRLRPAVSRPSRRLAGFTWSYSSKFMVISLLVVCASNLDLITTDTLLGHAAAGQFSVASAVVGLVTVPFEVFFPMQFASLSGLRKHSQRWERFRANLRIFLLALSLGCLALLTGSMMLEWIFGPKFAPASTLIPVMMIGYVCYLVHSNFSVLAMTANSNWKMAFPTALAAISTVPLTYLLECRFGLMGAAYAYAAVRFLWLMGTLVYTAYLVRVVIPVQEGLSREGKTGLTLDPR